MVRDQDEPNRVLGFPVRAGLRGQPSGRVPASHAPVPVQPGGQARGQREEPQRVLGFPVGQFRLPSREMLTRLARRVTGYRLRARRPTDGSSTGT